MKSASALPLLAPTLLAGLLLLVQSAPAEAQDRAVRVFEKNDADGDGRISRDEWKMDKGRFDAMDLDRDGYLSLDELRARFASGKGPASQATLPAAAGTVITKTGDKNSYRGMEIIIRHAPADTGLPVWIYTQYAHFDAMPAVEVGERVKMGQKLGPTGNSGRGKIPGVQSDKRRPAIHFAVWYSTRPEYVIASNQAKVIPVDGWWMDPNALYRGNPPFDTAALKALPEAEKKVPIPVMLEDGTTVPAGTKVIWPYACEKE